MKTYATIVTLLLLLALLGLYITYDQLQDKETASDAMKSVLTVEIDQLRAATVRRDTAILKQQRKMHDDSLKNRVAQNGLKIEIRTMRQRERSQRPDTVEITIVDSVYMADDALILSLTNERNAIQADCKTLTDSLISQVNDFKSIALKTDTLKQFAEKDLKKERKAKKWWRRATVGAGVVIIWLAVKPD